MAVIFYKPNGEIYGVHPDSNINVPEGIEFIEVPGQPHEIAWPIPSGEAEGSQRWSRVNLGTKQLEAGPVTRGREDGLSIALERAPSDAARWALLQAYLRGQ